MKKRLVICCDGTWQELGSTYPTNVIKLARLVKYIADDTTPQLVLYLPGCGTEVNPIERLGGGAFGWGIDKIIQEAYRFLCINYSSETQDEIYLFGFSRGAYLARSLAGMIYNCGILQRSLILEIPQAYEFYRNRNIKPRSKEARDFRKYKSQRINGSYFIPIKMLGCWDTVGALGIPEIVPWLPIADLWNQRYNFHDYELSPIIENAFHAVAIDEKRKTFTHTPMYKNDNKPDQVVEEVWFAGEHGCVGGGTEKHRGLSDFALEWMISKAKNLGLEFCPTEKEEDIEFQILPDATIDFDNSVELLFRLGGVGWRDLVDKNRKISDDGIQVAPKIHSSVIERLKARKDYRPENLKLFLNFAEFFSPKSLKQY
ncbi:conserved hypothetical protein [Gloeothece citriformis PCC 7424]|uniref:T6SS Phospholipase effector Tle1-like catalytic domain-containing protein n=1 Tax=Gloeothece citriformis (strain PCC 7424) TaxID=65393 RepID=B7K9R6_GLOC7|nr:DUF2235 domain-containing protein [Gloeothece citriformis]ACK70034.1 conserved hypothetical protein [Gloeothece citriformis PCC 7424]